MSNGVGADATRNAAQKAVASDANLTMAAGLGEAPVAGNAKAAGAATRSMLAPTRPAATTAAATAVAAAPVGWDTALRHGRPACAGTVSVEVCNQTPSSRRPLPPRTVAIAASAIAGATCGDRDRGNGRRFAARVRLLRRKSVEPIGPDDWQRRRRRFRHGQLPRAPAHVRKTLLRPRPPGRGAELAAAQRGQDHRT